MTNLKEIQEFLENIAKTDLHKVKIITEDLELNVQLKPDIKVAPATQQIIPQITHNEIAQQKQSVNETNASEKDEIDDGLITIKSSMVGTFYRKPSPDKPVFVDIGQKISDGDVICIIEAMKLFNEIEAEVTGEVVKILVEDGSPVEFEQPLFLVKPL